jgi:NAD(P)H-hydrate repair Nnr-like enzyme with NAD(P)H-hydrate epimerase domain
MRRVDREFGMEVLTTAEMERADRLTIAAGTPGFALMLSAGQVVAEAAMAWWRRTIGGRRQRQQWRRRLVAAAELAARGREVSVILLCERDSLQGDAASAAKGWKYPVLPFNPQAIGRPALIIDALFGAGLNRPVEGDPFDMIEAINANGAPVLSVDLPSGINGTTGAVMGAAIRATETVTFFRKKPAHLLLPGRMHCGRRVRVADIGIDASVLAEISRGHSRTFLRLAQIVWCRGSTAINTPGAMRSSSPAISPRPVPRGWRRGAPCGPAPGW